MKAAAVTLFAVALFASACSDFDLPSALSREQILAVRATPPAIPAGERVLLDALLAGPSGRIGDADLSWTVPEGASAAIELDAAGAPWLVAAAGAARGFLDVSLTATTPSGAELRAVKTIEIGAPRRENPTLARFEADGASLLEGQTLAFAPGTAVALTAGLEPSLGESFAWYATIGEITRYRHNPTEIVIDDTQSGWLVVVGRDGEGGITWAEVPMASAVSHAQ